MRNGGIGPIQEQAQAAVKRRAAPALPRWRWGSGHRESGGRAYHGRKNL